MTVNNTTAMIAAAIAENEKRGCWAFMMRGELTELGCGEGFVIRSAQVSHKSEFEQLS